jgi:hypothetical protein
MSGQKNYDFGSGLFLAFLSIGTCILAHQLGLGDLHSPGTGFIPFITAALLGLMSLGLVLRSFFGVVKIHYEIRWKPLILITGSLLVYGAVFNFLGFSITTFFFMIFSLRVIGHQKWWRTVTISILTVIGTNLLFVVWMDCRFPKGFLGI